MSRTLPCLSLLLALSLPALADDWPQWRGPQRDGKSSETGLLDAWPEGGPAVAWSVSGLGAGYSSVSVVVGRVFTLGDFEDGQYVLALRENDGSLLWKTRIGGRHEDKYGGPRSTPTLDGDLVFVESTDGGVVCLEAESGKRRWRRSLSSDFDGFLMKAMGSYDWRFSESPLVHDGRVVVTPGQAKALVVALDRESGEEVWRTEGRNLGERGADGAGYSSPVVAQIGDRTQYVQFVGRGVIGVDASSGKLLWSYNRVANDVANIATPIVSGDRIFVSSGYGTGAGLLRIHGGEQGFRAEELYFLDADTMQNHHGGMILHRGTIFTGTGHNKGFPLAVTLDTGKVAWGPERNAGRNSAAVSYADGRLYFRYQDGRMILVEATPEAYREQGSFLIPGVEKESWAHPVIANGRLWLREQDRLHVYDVRAPSQ